MITRELIEDLNIYSGMAKSKSTHISKASYVTFKGDAYGLFKHKMNKQDDREFPILLEVNGLVAPIDYKDTTIDIETPSHIGKRPMENFFGFLDTHY